MRLRRGPVLCDGGGGTHAALTPWLWKGKVLCPNCLLRAVSDAIRAGEAIDADPVEVDVGMPKRANGKRGKAVVVRLRPREGGDQLELFARARSRRVEGDQSDEN